LWMSQDIRMTLEQYLQPYISKVKDTRNQSKLFRLLIKLLARGKKSNLRSCR
jgi:hypothetical protein